MPLLLCPNCQAEMKEVNRNDVQIDICTSCRGVWLDRGELEKLLGSIRDDEQTFRQEQHEEELRREREAGSSNRDAYQERETVVSKRDDDRERGYSRPQYKPEHYDRPEGSYHAYGTHGKHRKKSAFERLSDLFD